MKLNQLKDILREVVIEEVRNVLREELNSIPLNEISKPKYQPIKKPTYTGNTIQDLLNETIQESDWRSMGTYNAQDAMNFSSYNQFNINNMIEPKTTSIKNFIDSNINQPNRAHHQIQVHDVPDFSKMVEILKLKGKL